MNRQVQRRRRIRFLQRREVWTLTLEGWWVVSLGAIALGVILLRGIYPFLAVSAPVAAEVLIVEGWVPDEVVKEAIAEFDRGTYHHLLTTGTPITHGFYLSEYKTFAELSAATAIALGMSPTQVTPIPTPNGSHNRTAAAAIAVKQWIQTTAPDTQAVNVYTLGPHARRSWFTFRRVLAPDIQVGVLAATPLDYNPQQWWQVSAGARSILAEAISYLYVRWINWHT